MNVANRMRAAAFAFAICLIAAPVAFAGTIGLLPFWSWIEAKFAIESIGHSGPAEWCYVATYVFILSCAVVIRLTFKHRCGK